MALHRLAKAWQFDLNNVLVGGGVSWQNDYKTILLTIKNLLTSNNWLVQGSSNSVAAGTHDHTDRWTTIADIVFAAVGAAHSWIVLQNDNINTGFQICIDCANAGSSPKYLGVYMSPSVGFTTGGTTLNCPTATDQITLRDRSLGAAGAWFYDYGASFDSVIHFMNSTDNQCYRIIVCGTDISRSFWIFEKMASPSASPACVAGVYGVLGNTSALRYDDWYNTSILRGQDSSLEYQGYLSTESVNSVAVGQQITVANEISTQWVMTETGVVSDTVPLRGRAGAVNDLLYGSTGVAEGSCYPADGSRTFVQFGHLVFPWDGATQPKLKNDAGVNVNIAGKTPLPAEYIKRYFTVGD